MTPDANVYPQETSPRTGGRQSLGTFPTYAEAQRLVDQLSDGGFAVESLTIVGRDLRSVEQVTGRLTTARAAGLGAAAGAWWGLFVGFLLALFSVSVLGPLLLGLVIGAVFGAVFGALGHAALRGQRDFTSVQGLVADRYEVLVEEGEAAEARRLVSR
jgi:Flp pilus assembly protein TadB